MIPPQYQRFTDRARKIFQLANLEAQRLNHEYIGTEHILLGLVKEGTGVAAFVLKRLGVDPLTVRREIERVVFAGPKKVTLDRIPQTPRAKRVIEFTIAAADEFNHVYVGSEHILLGLLSERDGVAAQVLNNLGIHLDPVRAEILSILTNGTATGEAKPIAKPAQLAFAEPPQRFEFPPAFQAEQPAASLVKPLLLMLLMSLIVNVILATFLWQLHFSGR